jgi:hypothetical protein
VTPNNNAMHAEHTFGRFEMKYLSRVPGDGRRYPTEIRIR